MPNLPANSNWVYFAFFRALIKFSLIILPSTNLTQRGCNTLKSNKRFKQLRHSKKLTQRQMAQILDITENQCQRYEYGTTLPTVTVLIAIADYFDVSLDYLVGRSDDPARH